MLRSSHCSSLHACDVSKTTGILTPLTRSRPYIYVYDVATELSSDIMQYRIERMHCTYRWAAVRGVRGTSFQGTWLENGFVFQGMAGSTEQAAQVGLCLTSEACTLRECPRA